MDEFLEIILSNYTKVLKINLIKDTYEIIKIEDNEEPLSNKFSNWIVKFTEIGNVAKEDRNFLIEATSKKEILRYFSCNSNPYVLGYKRTVEDEVKNVHLIVFPTKEKEIVYLLVKETPIIHSSEDYIDLRRFVKQLRYLPKVELDRLCRNSGMSERETTATIKYIYDRESTEYLCNLLNLSIGTFQSRKEVLGMRFKKYLDCINYKLVDC